MFTANWVESRIHMYPFPDTCITTPTINTLHQKGMFITTDESTLMHYYHPKSIIYITTHFLFSTFYGLWQRYNGICPLLKFLRNSLVAVKIHCASLVNPPCLQLLRTNELSPASTVFTFSGISCSWNHTVCFQIVFS
jgi:hypothetical protein